MMVAGVAPMIGITMIPGVPASPGAKASPGDMLFFKVFTSHVHDPKVFPTPALSHRCYCTVCPLVLSVLTQPAKSGGNGGANTAALTIINADKPDEESITIRQNKYLNNLVE